MKGKEVINTMMAEDAFSKWLGIKVKNVSLGSVTLEMKVKPTMLNGFNILHGGISYSLADSALAFAANSHGIQSVSIETSISHTKPAKENDILIATATEKSISKKIAIYEVIVSNQKEVIALFKGTVYRTGKEW